MDDVPSIRIHINKTMRGMGIETWHAGNGDQAYRLLHRHPFDIVVTDIEMPETSGLELLSSMRQSTNQRISKTPVIVTSSVRDQRIEQQVRFVKFAYFLPKPIRTTELKVLLQMIATSRTLRAERMSPKR
ncbi:response regulator [Roseimaritima multifibrata]|uniref:response regulator n=1 Tax=Roseimaritima multifibrata TaxID=1930274 RepID=UPI001C54CE28|nr:response regulator [Roseimaritima multifibrata]